MKAVSLSVEVKPEPAMVTTVPRGPEDSEIILIKTVGDKASIGPGWRYTTNR